MFRSFIQIISSSFKMALQELWKNKLRTFLSLFGITIGIFCIIGVLAIVSSLEQNIKNEVKSLGTNTIYIDKWEYAAGGGPDYPWWKYVNRPYPKFEEVRFIKERTKAAGYTAFVISANDDIEFAGSILSNAKIYGVSQDYEDIQPFQMGSGRYFSDADFDRGLPMAIIGNSIAEQLFGSGELAVEKQMNIRGKKVIIAGVIKKQGKQMIGGWDFDQSVLLTYEFAKSIIRIDRADPVILVQGRNKVSSKALKDELSGVMRAIHKLSPSTEDNFSLNDINDLSDSIGTAFGALNMGGWFIAGLSLIVGMFGVANIMFVTVRERTGQIGLKKALGAKQHVILTEFLLESAFLCIIGGIIGLSLVFLLTIILTNVVNFPVFISASNMILAIIICIVVGILAGFFPALQAAKMDPVVAIRSK